MATPTSSNDPLNHCAPSCNTHSSQEMNSNLLQCRSVSSSPPPTSPTAESHPALLDDKFINLVSAISSNNQETAFSTSSVLAGPGGNRDGTGFSPLQFRGRPAPIAPSLVITANRTLPCDNDVKNYFANDMRTNPLSDSASLKKRLKLALAYPSCSFGVPDPDPESDDDDKSVPLPAHLLTFLAYFSPSNLECGCVPQSPEIDAILDKAFPHELIAPYNRLDVTDYGSGRHLFDFVVRIHRACLKNSRVAEDETAWYPLVAALLAVEPTPSLPSPLCVPIPAPPPVHGTSKKDLFLVINVTTKPILASLHPAGTTAKLAYILAFNPEYKTIKPTATRTFAAQLCLNVFNDPVIRNHIAVLGVDVTSSRNAPLDAQYRLGVWGMKTLNHKSNFGPGKLDLAAGVSVCAHVWSMHITYWKSESEMVTYGPLVIGHTDTLYGTFKLVAFVVRLKTWASDEMWPQWEELLRAV